MKSIEIAGIEYPVRLDIGSIKKLMISTKLMKISRLGELFDDFQYQTDLIYAAVECGSKYAGSPCPMKSEFIGFLEQESFVKLAQIIQVIADMNEVEESSANKSETVVEKN